jgi:hypothetical protein
MEPRYSKHLRIKRLKSRVLREIKIKYLNAVIFKNCASQPQTLSFSEDKNLVHLLFKEESNIIFTRLTRSQTSSLSRTVRIKNFEQGCHFKFTVLPRCTP